MQEQEILNQWRNGNFTAATADATLSLNSNALGQAQAIRTLIDSLTDPQDNFLEQTS